MSANASTPLYERILPPNPLRSTGIAFARAEDVEQLIRVDFVGRGGLFFDPEHGHLQNARIGVLWASSTHRDKGSVKAGTAQLVKPYDAQPSKWGEAMQMASLRQFFGEHEWPHFRITLHAPTCARQDDREFFGLVDHEVTHCATAKDEWGAPRFSDATGLPVWSIRPHDHEGFAGTTERWGAISTGAAGIVQAGTKRARFAWVPGRDLDFSKACGTV